ncbi:MAG: ATP-grasp domain-containing protein, partial [Enterobacteriaceae bacterium]
TVPVGERPLASLVAERCLALSGEISVIVARNAQGECETFPVAENIHHDNILRFSIVPARQPLALQQQASQWALQIAQHLKLVGLLAVEFFICEQGRLYVNELAPRPHNSGHYSQDACNISQFSQHIRAICNLPLLPVQLLTPVVMVNILGAQQTRALALMQTPDLCARAQHITPCYHWYGKESARERRKMGHINLLVKECGQGLAWVEHHKLF